MSTTAVRADLIVTKDELRPMLLNAKYVVSDRRKYPCKLARSVLKI
jgi:hypothetical protein